jgi:N-glycosylase/DNA lyase
MEKLEKRIIGLKAGNAGETVRRRLEEFRENSESPERIFSELCFCICTANNSAERGIRAQKEIDFCSLPEVELRKKMKEVVCRFYNTKTLCILEARAKREEILAALSLPSSEARDWLVKRVKGLGYKEASHFLRNIGREDLAIIDFHILDILSENGLIVRPKSLTPREYIRIEGVLRTIALETGMSLAELDLYLWYMETGKILK